MIKVCRNPRYGGVTSVTLVIAGNVCVMLSSGDSSIMAGAACSRCYTRMIKYRWCPGIGGVAIIALVIAGNVLNIFP